ncbi:hypothetical protein [Clostridium gasigenes]|uniref:hypothetical protein n=1 Tax=Clostridium gasigenes TaxID=94869 RepID=UPI001C0DE540|nr:hypothetical protein [Clostridium gasigenes]MBU3103947.1 hypothetical protein [Clostridium gasigenes]
MIKNEILDTLRSKVGQDDFDYIQGDMVEEIEQCENPFEFVEQILQLMEDNPDTDFGVPGALTHFIESFALNGYEKLLLQSVKHNPTAHTVWLLHRAWNDVNDPMHEDYESLVEYLKPMPNLSEGVKSSLEMFD